MPDKHSQDTAPEPPPNNDGGTSLPTRVFQVLTHQRRRYILYYLRNQERVSTNDLAIHIAARELDTLRQEVSTKNVERVKTNLVQSQLPKLDDFGFVDYDPRTETVCYTHPPGLLTDALELAATIENSS